MDDLISRKAALDALEVLCQEHRYKIPGKQETYSQYNEAWQDALDRAESIVGNLPPVQPDIIQCKDCIYLRKSDPVHPDTEWCQRLICGTVNPEFFCADGRRKENK